MSFLALFKLFQQAKVSWDFRAHLECQAVKGHEMLERPSKSTNLTLVGLLSSQVVELWLLSGFDGRAM